MPANSNNYPSLDIIRRSATNDPPPQIRSELEVAKLIDVSRCIGCKACQAACSEWNDIRQPPGEFEGAIQNPPDLNAKTWTLMRFTEYENEKGDLEWLIRKDGCMHCSDPGCLKACPSPGAIVQYANGIVDFNEGNCIGCGYCLKGCPFNIPRYGAVDNKAYKCTLCSDRVAVGLEPACAKACPTGAIMFGSKANMIEQAESRVEELKERGYQNAGLYDPPGVDGTHVMYVLQHADKPEIYQGLPNKPQISPLVWAWKGGAKVLGLAMIGVSAVASFLHYMTVGPNEVPEDAEQEAVRL
ncbi:MAG: formate dehydrogenase subunit beta, partial [Acetobacteraceae bacterium]|nr:formate dehydrogenase subunit beta [Acetobacteraceae bacterium]